MVLRHAAILRNPPCIERRGLLCSKSKGRKEVVWLHTAAASSWAALHTVKRHGGRVEQVIILEVYVKRRHLPPRPQGAVVQRARHPARSYPPAGALHGAGRRVR
jgi:hypothetical protein